MFFVTILIDDSDNEPNFVNDLEFWPVIVELFGGEVELLDAVIAIDQNLCIDIVIDSGVSLVDGEGVMFIVK